MKNVEDITLQDVKDVMRKKGYKLFTKEGIPNLIGIRSASKINTYCDRLWVFWTENGAEEAHNYTVTTSPGRTYLENPIPGTKGTAILVPGQYIGCWQLGMHRGTHMALIQTGGPVTVYRDNNRDSKLDLNPEKTETGYFGINLHHGSTSDSEVVSGYSAGCQVWRFHKAHQELMQKIKNLSGKYKILDFSYTLLENECFT